MSHIILCVLGLTPVSEQTSTNEWQLSHSLKWEQDQTSSFRSPQVAQGSAKAILATQD